MSPEIYPPNSSSMSSDPLSSEQTEHNHVSVPPDGHGTEDSASGQFSQALSKEAQDSRQTNQTILDNPSPRSNPQPPSRKKGSLWGRLLCIVLLILFIACGTVGWIVYDFLHSPGTDIAVTPAHDVEVTINPGTHFASLSEELAKLGAVSDADKFVLLARWKQVSGKLKSGRFRVNTGWLPEQVLDQLINGSPILERVTIPEGLPWWETGKRLEAAGMLRYEDFKKIIFDPQFLRHWGIPFNSAEGFLYPDTYLLMRPLELNETTARTIVGRLIDTFWRKTASLWSDGKRPGPGKADEVRRLVILASIIEKETSIPSERATVAGVYANRLRLGMLLQADPTTAYGIGESFDGKLRRKHLDDPNNTYNTYKRPGLPPGPICSPGLACLRAAARPEQHDFLYFVAKGEGGSHVFSTNLADHNRAVRSYLNKLRNQK